MRDRRQFDRYLVARSYHAVGHDNCHHADLANQSAISVMIENSIHQPRNETVQLGAGISKTGQLDYGAIAKFQIRACRQRE